MADKAGENRRTQGYLTNSPSSVSIGHGRVIPQNPVVQSGDENLPAEIDLSRYVGPNQVFITRNSTLTESCVVEDPLLPGSTLTINPCYKVLSAQNEIPLAPINGRWAFPPNSDDFLQVNTFYHMKKAIEQFHTSLLFSYKTSQTYTPTLTSFPLSLFGSGSFWYNNMTLTGYSTCAPLANAFFDPSTFSLCFGVDPNNIGLKFAQDSSVIYHEIGHAFIKIMINARNQTAGLSSGLRTNLGSFFYDEAGSINEGIADYYSYVMTGRKHFGEWALKFYKASRPLSEDDTAHAPGIATTDQGRLSYPEYLSYDAYSVSTPIEDIHYAGQISSHFLMALTEELITTCRFSRDVSNHHVLRLIGETLAELGDLTARRRDSNTVGTKHINLQQSKTDLSDDYLSYNWSQYVNPINFRSFFQTLSRHFLDTFNANPICNGVAYSQDNFEKLLDHYGLLLFRTYNNDGNGRNAGVDTGHLGPIVSVNAANRVKSVLIPKDLLKIDPRQNASQAFVFDRKDDILKILQNLKFAGSLVTTSDQINDELIYNNGNGRVSPGEVVGLSLNLYNSSNSMMGGIQVLANDWDHAKLDPTTGVLQPCNNFADNFPLSSEGAASLVGDLSTVVGDCNHISKENGTLLNFPTPGDKAEPVAPVCFIQQRDTNETKWVSQEAFRKSIGLDPTSCLYQDGKYYNCFVNVMKGADHAHFSRIDANKTWGETFAGSGSPEFNASNLFLLEVNPSIPPGTTFDCRFRTRFTNCSDCYEDPSLVSKDDYLDYEYAGATPFKIIHLQFTVID